MAVGARRTVAAGAPGLGWPGVEAGTLLVGAFALVLGLLVLSPLAALLVGALLNAPPGTPGTLGLAAFAEAWSDPLAWSAAATSLGLALGRMAVVIPITLFLAWALTR